MGGIRCTTGDPDHPPPAPVSPWATPSPRGLRRRFVGVRLGSGAHTDAEGPSSDLLGELVCGYPATADVSVLHTLTLGWTGDFVDGTVMPELYPAADGTVATAPGADVLRGGS